MFEVRTVYDTLQRYWLYGAFQYFSYAVRLPGVFFTTDEQGNAVPMQCTVLHCSTGSMLYNLCGVWAYRGVLAEGT